MYTLGQLPCISPLLGFSPCYTDGSSLVVMSPSVGHMGLDVENLEVGLAFLDPGLPIGLQQAIGHSELQYVHL